MKYNSIQIFSPHIDDAILSLGGCILHWKSLGVKLKVNNVFTISNWTHTDAISGKTYSGDISEITRLRKTEEANVANDLKYVSRFWDFPDFPLRDTFSAEDHKNLEERILENIKDTLNKKDAFFFPLGIDHPDHLLIQRLSKHFLHQGYHIYFYEDLPYFSWGRFDYRKYCAEHCKDSSPALLKIDFEQKATIIRKYSSQICEAFLDSMRAYAYNKSDNAYYERYWKLLL